MTLMLTEPRTIPNTALDAEVAALQRECGQLACADLLTRSVGGREVALRARELNWCEVAEEAVQEAGCDWPDPISITATLTITLTVDATLAHQDRDKANPDFLKASLQYNDWDIEEALSLDDDWRDAEFSVQTINAEQVTTD